MKRERRRKQQSSQRSTLSRICTSTLFKVVNLPLVQLIVPKNGDYIGRAMFFIFSGWIVPSTAVFRHGVRTIEANRYSELSCHLTEIKDSASALNICVIACKIRWINQRTLLVCLSLFQKWKLISEERALFPFYKPARWRLIKSKIWIVKNSLLSKKANSPVSIATE